ncbi:GAL4-like transcriptional activator [Fusarium beomiforme]|uniref:GAL4-like transcriptional activator n=1 Tax=Fusarium beomiforme TaxID=44412 RepID=A0A9P5ABZ7_9HYPO|nr:GAL4-like transcriptional activator [Fusarium beomiforme]
MSNSYLTSLVKGGSSVRSLSLPAEEWVPENHAGTDSAAVSHTNRHIVRNTSQSLDRYHGPCSLYALCKEFQDDPLFYISENNISGQSAVPEQVLLQEMINEASNEPHLDMLSHPAGICLPPRQFLNLVIGPFFKNIDYATDVFVRSNFQPHVDRIYSQPIGPSDEGWAVCFNAIVLLGIKKEPTIQGNSHFVQTLLQTLKVAINNPRVFLTPRLVNVQALALLSYVAEQYSTTSLAELVFAQACLLARTMGLHQSNASSNDLPPEDILERHKVFRSLYIRDKNIAIIRGSTAWLPVYDSGIPPSIDGAETGTPDFLARLELAKIQDEVYQAFHAAGAPTFHPSRHSQILAQLQQRLEQWSSTYSIMQRASMSTETCSLMLSFFATRICLRKGNDDMRSTQAFKDAKACCLVFLLATTAKPDGRLSENLKEVLDQHNSLDPPSSKKAKRNSRTQMALSEHDDSATSALPRLAAMFPLAASFMVARGILLQPIEEADSNPGRPEEEISLLEALRDRFATAAEQAHVDNLALSFSRVLDLLVRIVRQKRSPKANNTPSLAFNELPSLHSTRSSSSLQESVVSSFRDTPPGHENFSTVSSISEAVSNSSLLLPFPQPLEDPNNGSPWFGNAGHGIGLSSTPVSMAWPVQHKRQSEEADHLTKRPRMSCQEEFFDIPAAYPDHSSRTEEDTLFTFDFLNTGADISVFDMED